MPAFVRLTQSGAINREMLQQLIEELGGNLTLQELFNALPRHRQLGAPSAAAQPKRGGFASKLRFAPSPDVRA